MTRITAGIAKGVRLVVPEAGVRPTTSATREAIFNALEARGMLDEAKVLDLYAGSGALGLEALSRGAREAHFVDNNTKSIAVLRNNIAAVGLSGTVSCADVLEFTAKSTTSEYDLIFADPPYTVSTTEVERLLTQVSMLVSSWGYIVLERPKRAALPQVNCVELLTNKRYGDTVVCMYRPLGDTESL